MRGSTRKNSFKSVLKRILGLLKSIELCQQPDGNSRKWSEFSKMLTLRCVLLQIKHQIGKIKARKITKNIKKTANLWSYKLFYRKFPVLTDFNRKSQKLQVKSAKISTILLVLEVTAYVIVQFTVSWLNFLCCTL